MGNFVRCVFHFASHINVQVLSERPCCSDGLSIPRADLIGSSICQMCSQSSVDPRSINHPISIDDGDAMLALQSWKIPIIVYQFDARHSGNTSTVRYGRACARVPR